MTPSLAYANEIRSERCQVKRRLKFGEAPLSAVLGERSVARMVLFDLLRYLPYHQGIKRRDYARPAKRGVRAESGLRRARVSGTRLVGDLTELEKEKLREEFG